MSNDTRSRQDATDPVKQRRKYETPAIRKEEEFERVATTCNFFQGPPRGTCSTAGSS